MRSRLRQPVRAQRSGRSRNLDAVVLRLYTFLGQRHHDFQPAKQPQATADFQQQGIGGQAEARGKIARPTGQGLQGRSFSRPIPRDKRNGRRQHARGSDAHAALDTRSLRRLVAEEDAPLLDHGARRGQGKVRFERQAGQMEGEPQGLHVRIHGGRASASYAARRE